MNTDFFKSTDTPTPDDDMSPAQAHSYLTELPQVLARDPRRLPAYLLLADAQCVVDRVQDAEQTLQRARAALPTEPAVLDKLAAVKLKQSDLKGVVEALTEQVRLDPTAEKANVNLVNFAIVAKDLPKAAQAAEAFAERCPNSWQAHYLYARMFDLVKRPQKAIAELRRAIELAPKEWKPYSDLGEILNSQGLEKKDPQMLAEAASVLERACALVGLDHPAPHFNLALAYWNLNRPQDTREKLREVLANITPDHRLHAKATRMLNATAKVH